MSAETVPPLKNSSDESLDQAIKEVYRIYGPDLAVFFSTVHAHSKDDNKEAISRIDWRQFKEP
jgi:hypothetical protein